MKNVLILGIGNILHADDGLGVHIVHHMEQSTALPPGVELLDGGTAGFDLITALYGRSKVVIVDALKAPDRPGSVYRFTPDQAKSSRACYSFHEVGIMEVIKTLNLMGCNPAIEFVGIVPEDINTCTIGLTDAVKNSIPAAVEHIIHAATH